MGAAKKPVATVKANFNTKTAAPAKAATGLTEEAQKAVAQEERKVEKKVEKKAVVKKEAPAAKAAEKKAAPVEKAAEKKTAPVEKAAEKKAAPAEKVAEKKAAPAEKAAEKKAEPAKKAAEKKEAPAAKISAEIILQFNGNDYTYDRLLQSAKDVWQYDQGKNVADFKTAQIYVKPEDNKVYVVVNGTDALSFDI